MPKLRVLSGKDVIKIFKKFGFSEAHHKSSHIKLRRVSDDGRIQTIIIPDHKELDPGTFKAIIRRAALYIPIEKLHPYFYTG